MKFDEIVGGMLLVTALTLLLGFTLYILYGALGWFG